MSRIKDSISQFHRAITAATKDKTGNLSFPRNLGNVHVSLIQNQNGVIKAQLGEYLAFVGSRHELITNKALLSQRLRQFISAPSNYIEETERWYMHELVCISIPSLDETLAITRAHKEASKIGIPQERLETDITAAKQKRRNALLKSKLDELAFKFDPDAQRLLHHPFLMSTK